MVGDLAGGGIVALPTAIIQAGKAFYFRGFLSSHHFHYLKHTNIKSSNEINDVISFLNKKRSITSDRHMLSITVPAPLKTLITLRVSYQ